MGSHSRLGIAGAALMLAVACGDETGSSAPVPPDQLMTYRGAMADCLRAHPTEASAAIQKALERPNDFRPNLTGHFDEGATGEIINGIGSAPECNQDEFTSMVSGCTQAELGTAPDGTDIVRIRVSGETAWGNSTPSTDPCDHGAKEDILCVGAEFDSDAFSEADGGTSNPPRAIKIGHASKITPLAGEGCEAPQVFPCDFDIEKTSGRVWGSRIECDAEQPAAGAADGGMPADGGM